jgi:hypothetical protein
MTNAEILAEAHGLLTRLDWTNITMKMRQDGPRCVGLALADVLWAKHPERVGKDGSPRAYLVQAIRERAPQLADIADQPLIIHWNDHVCADKAEALAVLKRAEELAGAERN